MYKFIITAKNRADIINLMMNTASVDLRRVKWNVNSITRSKEDAHVGNWMDLDDWVDAKEWGKVDEAIMSGDVPTVLAWWSAMTASTRFGVTCAGMGTSGSACIFPRR